MKAFFLRLAVIPVLALSLASMFHIASNYGTDRFWPVFLIGVSFFGGAFGSIWLLAVSMAADD